MFSRRHIFRCGPQARRQARTRVVVLERRQLRGQGPDPDPMQDEAHGGVSLSVLCASLLMWRRKLRAAAQMLGVA